MRGRSGVIAPASKTRQDAWNEPVRDGMQKHARFVWQAKWGNGSMSSGPTGRKATPRAMLARSLADRPVVSKVVTDRQIARTEAKRQPPKVIWPGPLADADKHFYA